MSPSFKAGARAGFRACLPVSVGLVPWALVTGLAMVGAGFSTVQAMGMSLIVFGATAQLGTLPLIVAGAPLWLAGQVRSVDLEAFEGGQSLVGSLTAKGQARMERGKVIEFPGAKKTE